jgi:hypothetical protein
MTIDWSWWAFVAGVLATLTVEFWVVIAIAWKQWKKQQKKATSFADDWTVDRMFGSGNK